jgi:hypothetical protein
VAPPKSHKSWLVHGLALSVVAGNPWIDENWTTAKGPVVIIDNELHTSLLSSRIHKVRLALKLPSIVEDSLYLVPLRGKDKSILDLGSIVKRLIPVKPKLLILDSLYRFFPEGFSENDNAAFAKIYNQIDAYANALTGTGIVVIHHLSKGRQDLKSVTDLGSGGGAQSRAADVHFALREHELHRHYVAEARVRSFPPVDPVVLKWCYPIWESTKENPERLKQAMKPHKIQVPPETITDDEFCGFLERGMWLRRKQVILIIKGRAHYSKDACWKLVADVVARHNAENLRAEDGAMDCGNFLIQTCRGGGLQFLLKVDARLDSDDDPS